MSNELYPNGLDINGFPFPKDATEEEKKNIDSMLLRMKTDPEYVKQINKEISEFLTPEKQEELINLFKK